MAAIAAAANYRRTSAWHIPRFARQYCVWMAAASSIDDILPTMTTLAVALAGLV